VTTDYSDWATNCPEYKVTAVEVGLFAREPAPAVGAAEPATPVTATAGG
jgi:formate dehydrogenase major subunit